MLQLDTRTMKSMQMIARQFPEFVDFLEAWKLNELDTLPDVVNNPGIAQGRCKVLKELTHAFREAPGWTA